MCTGGTCSNSEETTKNCKTIQERWDYGLRSSSQLLHWMLLVQPCNTDVTSNIEIWLHENVRVVWSSSWYEYYIVINFFNLALTANGIFWWSQISTCSVLYHEGKWNSCWVMTAILGIKPQWRALNGASAICLGYSLLALELFIVSPLR